MTGAELKALRLRVDQARREHLSRYGEARHDGPRQPDPDRVPLATLKVMFGFIAPAAAPTHCVYCGHRTRRLACRDHLALLLVDPVYTPEAVAA